MKTILSLLISLFLLASCSEKESTSSVALMASPEMIEADTVADVGFSPPVVKADDEVVEEEVKYDAISRVVGPNTDNASSENDKKVVKEGTLRIESANIDQSKRKLDSLIKKYHAQFVDENWDNQESSQEYTLNIRVPAAEFDRFLLELDGKGDEIIQKNISQQDVSEEYYDAKTRLGNNRKYLERYRELLKQANSVSEILSIENNIHRIMEEIESSTGKMRYLQHRVDYSLLSLTYQHTAPLVYKPVPQDSFKERSKIALHQGWLSLVNSCLWVISHWAAFVGVLLGFVFVRYFPRIRRIFPRS